VKVFLDTNVLMAACIEEHEHHERALPILSAVQDERSKGFTSGHAVLEMYSAMTRLPRSPRMLASQAMVLIQENILKYFTMVALTPREYSELVLRLGVEGTVGGQVYDALHLACARKCDADRVYTLNVRHFQNIAGDDLRGKILSP
jgi:predicted nucleic acid-binding protein